MGRTEKRHFNVSNYDGIDAWHDDAFQWAADCIACVVIIRVAIHKGLSLPKS